MIDSILKRFGYSKALTNAQMIEMIARELGTTDGPMDREREDSIMKDMNQVDGLADYLREIAALDKDRYFAASTPQEQLIARGAFIRTVWLRSKVTRAEVA